MEEEMKEFGDKGIRRKRYKQKNLMEEKIE